MKRLILKTLLVAAAIFCLNGIVRAQHENTELMNAINEVNRNFDALSHRLDVIEKSIDDLLWFDRVGDIAFIDKVYITGPPPAKESNPTGQGAGNPLKFWSYVFIPRDINPSAKYPLLVLPHGECMLTLPPTIRT